VRWHSVDTVQHSRAQARAAIESTLRAMPQGEAKLQAFLALENPGA
jgi:hypothetical protein